MDQLHRRRGCGILRRGAGLVEDLEDLVLAGVDPRPPSPLGFSFVASGEGVVVSRRHPLEVGRPCLCGCQPPHGRHHAVDGAVVSVALGQGALAGDVIDVSRPKRRQPGGEGGDGQDLCEDLRGVDEGLPLREHVEEPGRSFAEVIEDLVADVRDVAPTVAAPLALVSAGIVGNVSRLDLTAAVDEERVREDGGLGRPGLAVWDEPGLNVIQERRRREERVTSFGVRLASVLAGCAALLCMGWMAARPTAPNTAWVRKPSLPERRCAAGGSRTPVSSTSRIMAWSLRMRRRDAVGAEVDLDALYHLLLGGRLGLARLGLAESARSSKSRSLQSVTPAAVGRNVAQCSGRRTGHCRYALSMSWPKASRSVLSSAKRRARSTKSPTV